MMYVMIRMPILLAITAFSAPAHAAPSGDRGTGWKLDTGGAVFGVATRAYRAIDRGDIAVISENNQGPRLITVRDPSRVGLNNVESLDRRANNAAIASLSARLAF